MSERITVAAAAEVLQRPISTVKTWCLEHDLGELLTPRMRLLSPADMRRLRKLAAAAPVRTGR